MSLGYEQFLAKAGLTDDRVWRIMGALSDPKSHPDVDHCFEVKASPIHGVGTFATRKVWAGETFPVATGGVRYNLSRYVNHSDHPNAVFDFGSPDDVMRLLVDLEPGTEVLVDYSDNLRKAGLLPL
jgi:hypothetical protein